MWAILLQADVERGHFLMNIKVQLLDKKADAVRQNFPVHVFLSDFLALVKTFRSQEQELKKVKVCYTFLK